jgi:hypothetical protein
MQRSHTTRAAVVERLQAMHSTFTAVPSWDATGKKEDKGRTATRGACCYPSSVRQMPHLQ